MKRINKLFNPMATCLQYCLVRSFWPHVLRSLMKLIQTGMQLQPWVLLNCHSSLPKQNKLQYQISGTPGCSKPVRRPVCTVFCLYRTYFPSDRLNIGWTGLQPLIQFIQTLFLSPIIFQTSGARFSGICTEPGSLGARLP